MTSTIIILFIFLLLRDSIFILFSLCYLLFARQMIKSYKFCFFPKSSKWNAFGKNEKNIVRQSLKVVALN